MHLEELGLARKKRQSSLGTNLIKVTASHKDTGGSYPLDPARLKILIDLLEQQRNTIKLYKTWVSIKSRHKDWIILILDIGYRAELAES